MAIDLSAISGATTAAKAIGNLILVTPQSRGGYQPQPRIVPAADGSIIRPPPPSKLVFHYEGEQKVIFQSDITDHFVEDNTAIQDQIARKPIIISTHGFIGELNDVVPELLDDVKTAADKLTPLVAYIPEISVTAQLIYANAFQAYQTAQLLANAAVAAWSSIGGSTIPGLSDISEFGAQNKQQQMFTLFKGYYERTPPTLFTVETPWGAFQNMAILNLTAIQDAETRVITDFEVQFKQINFASTLVAEFSNIQVSAGRAAVPGEKVSKGVVNTGSETTTSVSASQ